MSETEPTLLETYVNELKRQGVNDNTVAVLTSIASVWIDVLRRNPHRLSGPELTLLTMNEIDSLFRQHMDALWGLVIDPDQRFGRIGKSMHPFLIE